MIVSAGASMTMSLVVRAITPPRPARMCVPMLVVLPLAALPGRSPPGRPPIPAAGARESSLPYVTQAHAPELGNLSDDILDRLPGHADDIALARMVDGEWQDVTLGEFHRTVVGVAKGL